MSFVPDTAAPAKAPAADTDVQEQQTGEGAAFTTNLRAAVDSAYSAAVQARDTAGRTPGGRLLAVITTDLEKVVALVHHNGL